MGGLDPRAARSDACARPLTDRQFALQTAFALTRARRMPLAQRAAASIMVADQVLDWLRAGQELA